MMLVINYALNNQFKDYKPFFEAIKANSLQWWHYLDSTWIVNTNLSANDFAHRLFPHFEKTDYLLVARLTREHQGWLPKEAWDWLNDKQY